MSDRHQHVPFIDVLDPDCYANAVPEVNGMPHAQYAFLRDERPVFGYQLPDPDLVDHAWVVSRYEDVVSVLRDDELFISGDGSGLRLQDPTCPALTVPSDPDLSPSREALISAATGIWGYGLELGQRCTREPRVNMMTTIAAAAERGELSDDEVMGFMLSLTAAGTETTRNTSAHAMLALLQRPDATAWLRSHAAPIPDSAVEEMLRWSSPVIHSRRTARRSTVLHDVLIQTGDAVVVLYPAANFDPRAFGEPRQFDLARTPNRHVTFATGKHVCLGAHIARLELRILFEELFSRTSSFELTGPIKYVRDARMRGIKQLPVRLRA